VADPIVASIASNRNIYGAAIDADLLLVGVDGEGLRIYSIGDPAAPVLLGETDHAEQIFDIAVRGSIAYLANDDFGLTVVDYADPTNPIELARHPVPGWAVGVDLLGPYALVACQTGGVQIFDISDPSTPTLAGSFTSLFERMGDLFIRDGIGYVTGRYAASVIDLADPTSPVLLASISLPNDAHAVAVAGDAMYLSIVGEGFRIYDVSEPSQPTLRGTIPLFVGQFEIVGDTLYAEHGSKLLRFDISDPFSPIQIGEGFQGHATFGDIVVTDELVCLTYWVSPAIELIARPLPDRTPVAGVSSERDDANDLVRVGDRAYVAWGDGIGVFDITDPTHPGLIAVAEAYRSGFESSSVSVSGSLAAVSQNGSRATLFDLTDPDSPQPAGVGFADARGKVHLDGMTLYTSSYEAGVYIMDASDPADTWVIGRLNTDGSAFMVAVDGDTMYVADNQRGLIIADISNIASPVPIARLDTGSTTQFVALTDGLLVVGDRNNGLFVYDAADPRSPVLLFNASTPQLVTGVALDGRLLFVTMPGRHAVHDLEAADPAVPIARTRNRGSFGRTALKDGYLLGTSDQVVAFAAQDTCLCTTDIDGDGFTSIEDLQALVALVLTRDPAADLNGDGSIDFFDLAAYLDRLHNGCPSR
jgi:hypothetical protein